MKPRFHLRPALLGFALMLALVPVPVGADEACSVESFGEAVDDSAAELRAFSTETQPRLKQKLQQLRDHKGWPETEYEAKGLALVHDASLDAFDAEAGELLGLIDTLGSPDPADPKTASCTNLDELKAASSELMAVMRAKSDHLINAIDREIGTSDAAPKPEVAAASPPAAPAATPLPTPAPGTDAAAPAPAPTPEPARRAAEHTATTPPAPAPEGAPAAAAGQPDLSPVRRTETPRQETPPATPMTPPDLQPIEDPSINAENSSSWSTTTAQAVAPPAMVRPAPPPGADQDDLPPGFEPRAPGDPPGAPYVLPDHDAPSDGPRDGEAGYSIEEIREATRGFFGTISTSLASVIEHAFQQSGRPTAYVLGREGGAAFLAGLRYGEGTLYLRSGGQQQVYWHGPSIGYDMGADGSRTLFLIYSLDQPENLFRRFTGVDGSAYLVGGVGMTLLRGGNVTMAPIRSGLGLRLGASIGYVRFTPRPTWNPF